METVLAGTGMRFDALVCADDVSVTKPDPEPYLLAAKLLDVDPARCFALEDSPNGVASAEAAGLPGHRGAVAAPDRSGARPAGGALTARLAGRRRRGVVAKGDDPRASTGVNPSAPTPDYDLDFR